MLHQDSLQLLFKEQKLYKYNANQIKTKYVNYLFGAVNDVNKLRLEGSTAHQESVDVRLRVQLFAVGGSRGTTVDDSGLGGNRGGHVLLQPSANLGVSFLGLLRRGGHTRADGPHGLVGNHHLLPVRLHEGSLDGFQLLRHYIHRGAVLAISQLLTDASHHRQTL